MTESGLSVENLSFSYGNRFSLENINFFLPKSASLGIIGKSGSGKSSLLKLIYGLFEPSSGSIKWCGTAVPSPNDQLIPGAEFMRYVPQDFGLMPHKTLKENLAEQISFLDEEREVKLQAKLHELYLKPIEDQKVKKLSGGEIQRAALAKSLLPPKEIALLDEAFGQLDLSLKSSIRRKYFKHINAHRITAIIATHDMEDVFGLCEYILVLSEGKQLQFGQTEQVFENPQNIEVARLFAPASLIEALHFTNAAKAQIIYPWEFVIAEQGLGVTITEKYLGTTHYTYYAQYAKEKELCFYSRKELPINEKIYLKIKTPFRGEKGLQFNENFH
ncbi:MAG: ATP-binding cassette domain-containing protein [Flavobacteriaceae bacterium]|nr:ATP-binding cassette domain-containing protein [Flavobacteriaceae bacterium]